MVVGLGDFDYLARLMVFKLYRIYSRMLPADLIDV